MCLSLLIQTMPFKRAGRRPSKSNDKGLTTSSGPSRPKSSLDGFPSFVFLAKSVRTSTHLAIGEKLGVKMSSGLQVL